MAIHYVSLQLGFLQSYHSLPVHIFLLHAPLFTPPSMNNLGSKYYEHCFSLRYWNLPLTPILAYVRCNKGWPLTMSMLSHKAVSGSSNPFCTPLRRSHVDSPPHLEPQRHNTQTQIVTHNMVTSSSSSDEEQPPAHIPTHHVCTPSPDVQYMTIWLSKRKQWLASLLGLLTYCMSLLECEQLVGMVLPTSYVSRNGPTRCIPSWFAQLSQPLQWQDQLLQLVQKWPYGPGIYVITFVFLWSTMYCSLWHIHGSLLNTTLAPWRVQWYHANTTNTVNDASLLQPQPYQFWHSHGQPLGTHIPGKKNQANQCHQTPTIIHPMNLQSTHFTVCEALAPLLMDGTITLEVLEHHLSFFYKLQATQSMDQLAFLSLSPSQIPFLTSASSAQSSPTSSTIALPTYCISLHVWTSAPTAKRSAIWLNSAFSWGGGGGNGRPINGGCHCSAMWSSWQYM